MTEAAQHTSIGNTEVTITPAHVMLAFAGLFLLNLLLRVFYLRYDFVNGDEGVRALSAVRMLEGARLYADVVTDKPPGASLFYAAVFTIFGRSMKAVHLAAIVWNFATSVVVYLIAARFYNKRHGLWAALLFVYFSTNYFTQDMMAANTELLMALPYTAAFLCFVSGEANRGGSGGLNFGSLMAAGALTGVGALFKQVGVLNLLFFAVYECWTLWRARAGDQAMHWRDSFRRTIVRLSLAGVGFILVLAVFALWLKSMGALGDFWRNAVVLNMFYIDSEPINLWVKFGAGRGLGYVFFNAALWALAVWTLVTSMREVRADDDAAESAAAPLADLTIALWSAVSLIGVLMSGRFYGHYFIPALPALSLLASRSAVRLVEMFRVPATRRSARLVAGMLGLLFLVGVFRCHHRTAVLAYETLTGKGTRWSADWGMTKRQAEAEIIAAYVRERIPAGEALYIWGYAHDVFWRTGCRPASRYLTPYYIDGRFADAESAAPSSGEGFRREAAANLLDDLRRNKPRLILDIGGGFKKLPNAELVEFVDQAYRDEGTIGPNVENPFRVLGLKDGPMNHPLQ